MSLPPAVNMVTVDGGVLEGGGQILRIAIAFSGLLKKPIRVENIRAGRRPPGLSAQHIKGLEIAKDVCNGKLIGGTIGSTTIDFLPGKLVGGTFKADTKTAGSISLLIQSALPFLIYSKRKSTLNLKGGTNADFAPPIEFTQKVFVPYSKFFNISVDITVQKKGFYPQGGGEVTVKTDPTDIIQPVTLVDRGEIIKVTGYSFVAGVLPIKMAHAMADEALDYLKRGKLGCSMDIHRSKETPDTAFGNGSGIILLAETSTGCILSGSSLGKRGKGAPEVGRDAAADLLDNINIGGCMDTHMQDQLIIFMALANGKSRIRTGPVSLHTETAIHIAHKLTKAKFTVTEDKGKTVIIECEGIGYSRETRDKSV